LRLVAGVVFRFGKAVGGGKLGIAADPGQLRTKSWYLKNKQLYHEEQYSMNFDIHSTTFCGSYRGQ
jgi:hypothetical protein